jgi:hypothetical protein
MELAVTVLLMACWDDYGTAHEYEVENHFDTLGARAKRTETGHVEVTVTVTCRCGYSQPYMSCGCYGEYCMAIEWSQDGGTFDSQDFCQTVNRSDAIRDDSETTATTRSVHPAAPDAGVQVSGTMTKGFGDVPGFHRFSTYAP